MADIDLTKLSYVELLALEKRISEEKELKAKGVRYKSEILSTPECQKVEAVLEERLLDAGLCESNYKMLQASNAMTRFEKAVLTICDLAVGNYKVVPACADEKITKLVLVSHGGLITENVEKYEKLAQDICAAVYNTMTN